jgi:hypothetical protein
MKRNTVARGISDRAVDGGDLSRALKQLAKEMKRNPGAVKDSNVAAVLNLEVMPLLRELRTKANLDLRENATATTLGDGMWSELWRSPELETNGTYTLRATVEWANADQTVWARSVVSNAIVSSNGTVTITTVDSGDIHYSSVLLVPPRWTADTTNRQAVLEFKDDGAAIMSATAVVTMSAQEF